MAVAAARVLQPRLRGGLVVAPSASGLPAVPAPLELVIGGHPIPTRGSEEAGQRALALARRAGPNEQVLFLLSGGASALMAVPADGITLDDKRNTTARLLRAGADIHALNTVRKHLSAIKGGQLAAATSAKASTLAISDVVGDDLSVIASGPTVGDASTFQDALGVLRRFGGASDNAYSQSVVSRLILGVEGAIPETPKPGDPRLARGQATVIGSRHDAMRGAEDAASACGYDVHCVEEPIVGQARAAAHAHLEKVRARVANGPRPLCVISSGETTVQVTGRGRGGRNQEFALALLERISSLGGVAALASVGTDGVDGPTDAAGAIIDSSSARRAHEAGLMPDAFLDDNNAYAFFSALGDLIHTGPTGTNVGDLQVILLA
jgi:hydroxypyruvate reductase